MSETKPPAYAFNAPPKYPHGVFRDGSTRDIYDVANAFGVTSHALFNALKKVIRNGRGEKTAAQDLREAIFSIQRHLNELEAQGEPK